MPQHNQTNMFQVAITRLSQGLEGRQLVQRSRGWEEDSEQAGPDESGLG